MAELLWQIIPFLGAAIGAIIFLVLIREAVRSLKRRRWHKQREHCLSLIGRLKVEEFLPLALELKKSFSLPLIESILDDFGSQGLSPPVRQKLAGIYDHLGFVEHHIKTLREAKSWSERANAAEKLGQIGHAQAVLPLITSLQDASENREVKSVAMQALGKVHDERAIEPLIEALGLSDPVTGQPLADTLAQFGEAVLQPLMKVLSSSKREAQRFWATRILGGLKTHRATSILLNALSDHSPKVRSEAALALRHLGAHQAVHPLSKMLLEDPVPLVRDEAAEALGSIGDDRALATLKEGLADLDYAARRRAMESLEKMGEKVIPFFLEVLQGESKKAAAQAAAALERMGALTTWIEDLRGEKWQRAFELLTRIVRAGVVETLARSLTHPQLPVRIRLCRILSEGVSPRIFEALTEIAQKDTEWAARLEALLALTKLADVRSIPLLTHALGEEEETIREHLLIALRKAPRSLLDPLTDTVSALLQDANLKIRVEAIRVLAKMHTEGLSSLLVSSLSDAFPEVRREAALALQYYPNKEGVQALIAALQDPDREVRAAAVKSLGQLKDPQAIGPLANAFEQADEGYRDNIAAALAAMPIQELYQLTDLLMGSSHPRARVGITRTLALIGDQKSIGLLTTFLKDPEPMVRASAASALGRFRRKEVALDLVVCLSDPNEEVRAAAVNALGKSGDPAVIKNLLSLLEHEPDAFVCQHVAIAVGCLAADQKLEVGDQRSETEIIRRVCEWLKSSTEINSQAAGLIALALLQDESNFQKIFRAIQEAPLRAAMQGFLKGLSGEVQDRFFAFLSLDPQLFWRDRSEKSYEHYIQLLQSSHEAHNRLRAIEALSTLREKAALPAIESAFAKDPSPQVRAAALAALGAILEGGSLFARIAQAVQDPSDTVRSQVLSMLNRLSPKELEGAQEQLILLLDTPQETIRKPAAELLARLYHHDWHALADQLLGTEKQSNIIGLIETLGKINDPKMSSLFVQFMKHGDPEVRSASAHAAATSGVLAKQEWIPYLDYPQEDIRLAAIQGLGKQLDGEVLDIFAQHLEDPSQKIRREIANLLGKGRLPGEERATQILWHLARDENLEVKLISLIYLFRSGVTGLAKEVAAIMPNFEKRDREAILECLQKEGVLAQLVGILRHSHQIGVRKEAIEFLAALDLPHYAGEIADSLEDPASDVRLAAIEVLGQIEDPAIKRAIESLAQDPVEEVRLAVKRRKVRVVK
ncbi:MAG: HEAT repeat domain-containing protein [Desulfobacteraceae bacterium]|nr:HEAT repeat domain-containing protein [Desulfobacteraceae bacterium]